MYKMWSTYGFQDEFFQLQKTNTVSVWEKEFNRFKLPPLSLEIRKSSLFNVRFSGEISSILFLIALCTGSSVFVCVIMMTVMMVKNFHLSYYYLFPFMA